MDKNMHRSSNFRFTTLKSRGVIMHVLLSIVAAGTILGVGNTAGRVQADSLATQINAGTDQLNGSMVITNDEQFVYVASPDTSMIKKFDLTTGQLRVSIPAFNAGRLTLTNSGDHLLALTASSGAVNHPIDQLVKISIATDQVVNLFSTSAWPSENGSPINLGGLMLMPDGVHVLVSYRSGASAFLMKVNISNGTTTAITLPSEYNNVTCEICQLSSDGNFLYIFTQRNGWRNFLSRVDLNQSVTAWSQQLPLNALPRNFVEAADGFLYVLGSDGNASYQNTYVYRFNPTTGVRDSQSEIDTLSGSSWNDRFFLVDDGWGFRFFTQQRFNGEYGFQWRITSHHLHLTNLRYVNSVILNANGEGGGFAINQDSVVFYSYVEDSWTHAIYTAQLEDDNQILTAPTIPNQVLGLATPSLSGSASSGSAVSFTSNTPNICTVTGTSITGVSVGICNIQMTQAGGRGWKPASTSIVFQYRKPTIAFGAIADITQRTRTTNLSAQSDSGLPVQFSSRTSQVCTVARGIVTAVSSGRCLIVASQEASGSFPAADDVERQFSIFKSSLSSEVGVSLNEGSAFTNNPLVTLSLAWPEFATGVKISNDGGFSPAKTTNFSLDDEIDWTLDSSFKGTATKIVYLKFTGVGIDSSRIYSDDIILDTTAPTLTDAVGKVDNSVKSGVAVASLRKLPAIKGVKLTVRAKDALSGIGQIQIKSSSKGAITTLLTSNPKATSRVVRFRTAKKTLFIRVVDRAGNYSRWVRTRVQ
jgi:hypothetical protein